MPDPDVDLPSPAPATASRGRIGRLFSWTELAVLRGQISG